MEKEERKQKNEELKLNKNMMKNMVMMNKNLT